MTHISWSHKNLKVKGSLLLKGLVASAFLPGCKEACGDKGNSKAEVALDLLIVPRCDGQGRGKLCCYCQSFFITVLKIIWFAIVHMHFQIKCRLHLSRLFTFGQEPEGIGTEARRYLTVWLVSLKRPSMVISWQPETLDVAMVTVHTHSIVFSANDYQIQCFK